MPLDDVDASFTARLRDVTRGAIGKGRARMRLAREVALHSSDFDLEPFFSLFLRYRADAQTDPNPEISLIDESSAVREDSDAQGSRRMMVSWPIGHRGLDDGRE